MADNSKIQQLLALGVDPVVVRAIAQQAEAQAAPNQIASLGDIPDPSEQEREGMMTDVGRKVLGGLQYVGETLDKPGRALRGLLAGRPGQLLDILPFSDTLGLTTPTDDTSGRDLGEQYGLLNENTDGLDTGDVAGFVAEVALDPLAWFTLGGNTIASQVLKNGSKGAKALTAATKAAEIADGTRKLVKIHTPSFGIPLPAKVPFTDIAIPRAQLPVKDLVEFGTGKAAAKAYKALNYSKFSPNPYIRKIFSAIPEVNELPTKMQEQADLIYESRVAAQDAAGADAVKLFEQESQAQSALAGLTDKTFFDAVPGGRKGKIAEAVKEATGFSDEAKKILHAELGADFDFSKVIGTSKDFKPDEKLLNKVVDVFDRITTNQKKYGDFAEDLRVRHGELLSQVLEQAGNTDPLHAKWFDDSIRKFVENKGDLNIDAVIADMKNAGYNQGIEGFDKAAESMYALSDSMRGLYRNMQKELQRLGIDVDDLNDYYVGYSHRRPKAEEGSALYNYLRRRLIKTTGAPFMIARDDVFRNIPLGTKAINNITRDARFTGVKFNKEEANRLFSAISDTFAPEFSRQPTPGTYLESLFEVARREGVSYAGLKAFANDVRMQQRVARSAAIAHKKSIEDLVSVSGMGPNWRKSINDVVKADGDWTSIPRFDEVVQSVQNVMPGITGDELFEILKSHGKSAYATMSNEQVAEESLRLYKDHAKYAADDAESLDTGFNPDLFDVAKDKTGFPDPAFNDGKLQYTRNNAAYLLAKEYDLPAWWRFDELMRNKLKTSADPALKAIADADQSEHLFKTQLWDHMKDAQKDLPPEARWAEQAGDVDDFIIDMKNNSPELREMPIMGQEDLLDLVGRLYHMPKEVLKEGLFNRGTTTDAVDYLMLATRLKAGVASLRTVLRGDGILQTGKDAQGVPLLEMWTKPQNQFGKGAGLTMEGLRDFVREVHDGQEMSLSQVDDFIANTKVDPEIADSLSRYIELFKDPEKTSELSKWADAMTSHFKGTLTIPYPAFHTRNRMSGLFANWVAGIYDADAEKHAQNLFFGKDVDEELLREIKALNIISVGRGGAEGQVYDRLERFRGVGADYLPAGRHENNARNLVDYIRNPLGELIQDTRYAYKQGGRKAAVKQVFKGGINELGETATDLNPFGTRGGFDPLGASTRKTSVDKFGRPVKGADLYTAPTTTNAIYKAGSNANDYVEWMNRVAPYIAMRKAGWSPAMAARKVRQVQFDYREMSTFEQRVAKKLVPFYSYTRKNLEQQVRLLMENPGGRTAQTIRAEKVANQEAQGKHSYVPKYLAESFAVRLPGGTEQDAQFFSQSGLLPAEEAFNRFAFNDRGLNMKRTAEKFLAQIHPMIQGPAEWIAGRQFWSGRNLNDLYQTPTTDQDVNLLLSKMPASRLAGTVGGLLDNRKSIPQRAFNFAVGGAKVTDVNIEKQRALELRDILEKELQKDPDIAAYTGLYAKDIQNLVDRYNAGDQESARQLKMYMDLKAELMSMKKADRKETAH